MRVQGRLCALLLLWMAQAKPSDFCMLDRDSARIQSRPASGVGAVSCRAATLQLEFSKCTRSSASIELQVRCMLQLSRSERVVVVADKRPLWMDRFAAQQRASWASGQNLLAIKTACTGGGRALLVFGPVSGSIPLNLNLHPSVWLLWLCLWLLWLCHWLLCLCLCLTISVSTPLALSVPHCLWHAQVLAVHCWSLDLSPLLATHC